MEAAQEALVAWRREGLRLVSLLSAPDDVRDLITEASERLMRLDQPKRSRAPLVLTEAGEPDEQKRRRALLSRTARHTCFSVFLDLRLLYPVELCALISCSRGMEKLASADTVWQPLTRYAFPDARSLHRAGARKVTRRRDFIRMARLWQYREHETVPGVEAYVAVVMIKLNYPDFDREIFRGSCPLKVGEESAASSRWFEIDIDIAAPRLRRHNIEVARGDPKGFPLRVSVFLVRKIDGKCKRLVTNAVYNPRAAAKRGEDELDYATEVVPLDADASDVPLDERPMSLELDGLVVDDDGFLAGISGDLRLVSTHIDGIYSCANLLDGWDRSANWL